MQDPGREVLAARLRSLLDGTAEVREQAMFGTRAFLVEDRLVVCARSGGDLLVRVDADRAAALAARPGAAQAVMGPGRSMGPGWIDVEAESIADDGSLRAWLDEALAHRTR